MLAQHTGWAGRVEFQAVNETTLTRPRPFDPLSALGAAGPPGIVTDSVAREAADRNYQIRFHCHAVPQNPCPTLRQSGAARTYGYRARTKSSGY